MHKNLYFEESIQANAFKLSGCVTFVITLNIVL